jgi:hypothetical protein
MWRACLLTLSLLGPLARPAIADTIANYQVRGSGATVFWRLEQGTESTVVVALAFSDLAPLQGDTPPPGPRILFTVTRLVTEGASVVRRQWYGDAPLKANDLVVSSSLAEARIDVKVMGTLEEQPASGDVTRRVVEGTLRIRWTAKAAPANTTLAINHQATPVSVQLNAVGQARLGEATVTVNVPGLGGRVQETGPGTILAPGAGTLTLKRP